MEVLYTQRAVFDHKLIHEYLYERSPQGARSVLSQIRNAVERLRVQPHSGHATDIPDVLVLFVGRYPYKVFYRIQEEAIEIIHIRHTARRLSEFE